MNKKLINEEQFKKLVIKEANKIFSEKNEKKHVSKRKITFDKVESLINEMKNSNKSITSIKLSTNSSKEKKNIKEEKNTINRDLDVIEHNKKKNIIHANENEKCKWNRMINYNVPSDEER